MSCFHQPERKSILSKAIVDQNEPRKKWPRNFCMKIIFIFRLFAYETVQNNLILTIGQVPKIKKKIKKICSEMLLSQWSMTMPGEKCKCFKVLVRIILPFILHSNGNLLSKSSTVVAVDPIFFFATFETPSVDGHAIVYNIGCVSVLFFC